MSTLTSDQYLEIEAKPWRVCKTGLYTYPDQSGTTLLNPAVIFEVLSDSTEAYDRGDKFWHYRQIPWLREYILVSKKAFRVEQFVRQPDVSTVGCSISLRAIYFKTELIS